MPFTLSHPVASIPFWYISRKRLDLLALIVGSTVPDIQYFLALQPVQNIGHTLVGSLTEGLLSGWLLVLACRYLLWEPMLAVLPKTLAQCVPSAHTYSVFSKVRVAQITLSIWLGAVTHIVWDSFTHANQWGVKKLPVLSETLLGLAGYKWLQYGGGAVGLLFLSLWVMHIWRQTRHHHRHRALSASSKRIAWSAITLIALGMTLYAMFPFESPSQIVVNGIIGSIVGLWLGVCGFSLAYILYSRIYAV